MSFLVKIVGVTSKIMRFKADNLPNEVIECIDVAPNNAVAIGTFRPYSSCAVYITDSEGKTHRKLIHNFPISALKFCSLDSSILVSVSDRIRIWNSDSGSLLAVLEAEESDNSVQVCPFTCIDFLPESFLFAVSDTCGSVSVWDASSKQVVEIFQLGSEKLFSLSFVAPGFIACLGETGSVFIIDRQAHQVVCSNSANLVPPCQPMRIAWLHMHSLVAVAFQTSGVVSVFEYSTLSGAANPKLIGSTKPGESIADISWDQAHPTYLVVARDSGLVQVFHKANLESPHFDSRVHAGASCLAWTMDGLLLIGNVSGEVVQTRLPDTLETGGATLLKTDHGSTSYPALA